MNHMFMFKIILVAGIFSGSNAFAGACQDAATDLKTYVDSTCELTTVPELKECANAAKQYVLAELNSAAPNIYKKCSYYVVSYSLTLQVYIDTECKGMTTAAEVQECLLNAPKP